MEKFEVKDEFLKRYKYIYENSKLILLPYVYLDYKCDKTEISFKKLDEELLLDLESFLLSDTKMEESNLYKRIESNKNNKEYLQSIKSSIDIISDSDINSVEGKLAGCGKIKLDEWDIFLSVWTFIKEQAGKNKIIKKEIDTLDLYFEMARYTNDGKVWRGGRYRSAFDYYNGIHPKEKDCRIIVESIPKGCKRKNNIKEDTFISTISEFKSNDIKFLNEEDKSDVYFLYHDELPYGLEFECSECDEKVMIDESKIFINPDNDKNRYCVLCPHCEKIINIDEELLSDMIKLNIEKRCLKDPYLFRKISLYSELQSLKNMSSNSEYNLVIKK